MYNYQKVIAFIMTLSLETKWAERAISAAKSENVERLWSALERGLGYPHNGMILEILRPFEI